MKVLFRPPALDSHESEVLHRIEELRTSLRYHVVQTPRRWTGSLRRVLFARAIQGSNTIEGYNATLADAAAVVEGEPPLEAEQETAQALAGYRDAMTYVLQLSGAPHFAFSAGLLNSLHFMMLKYDITKGPGLFRAGPVYVRSEATGEIVYEGPAAEIAPSLVAELMAELEHGDGPTVIRGAMAHLNLVMIHPYRDGNGRIARVLQSLVLSRDGILAPEFASIEEYLGRNTQGYYQVLAEVGGGAWDPTRDPRAWIRFCLTAHHRQAQRILRRARQASRLWETLEGTVRSLELPDRTVLALFDAAQRLRVLNRVYREQAEISEHAGGRDLRHLVQASLLEPRGERRGRFYVGSPRLLELVAPVWETDRAAEREDPFAAT